LITENLFPAFQHLKTFAIYVFEPETNAPKQYACFLRQYLFESKKTGKLLLNRDSG